MDARPERRSLLERLAAARARIEAARADRLPQVFLSGGYDYANPNPKILPRTGAWRGTWDVGVELNWNVFDSGRTASKLARAIALERSLENKIDELDRRVTLEVRVSWLEVRTADRSIETSERALAAALENRRVATERHRNGLLTPSELLDAEIILLRAGLERTESLAAARVTRARLARAAGQQGEEP